MAVLKSPTCQKQEEEGLEASHLPGRTVAFKQLQGHLLQGLKGAGSLCVGLKMPMQLLVPGEREQDRGYTGRVCIR